MHILLQPFDPAHFESTLTARYTASKKHVAPPKKDRLQCRIRRVQAGSDKDVRLFGNRLRLWNGNASVRATPVPAGSMLRRYDSQGPVLFSCVNRVADRR